MIGNGTFRLSRTVFVKLRVPLVTTFAVVLLQDKLVLAQCPPVTNIATETLTFDDLSPGEFSSPIPNGYGSLQWNNFGVFNGSIRPVTEGYRTGNVSPPNVAFNDFGDPASISITGTFTLNSAHLTSAGVNQGVRVQGFVGTKLAYDNSYAVTPAGPVLANFNYVGVSRVTFTASAGSQFVMDNLVISNLVTVLPDSDGDGVPDCLDHCPDTPPGAVVDADGCSVGQLVPCDGSWTNHGQYVVALAAAANSFVAAGLMATDARDVIVQAAAQSDCGKQSHSNQGQENPHACLPDFAPAVGYGAGVDPVFVATGDFNGDGKLDLATLNFVNPGIVTILSGNGDGTFQPAVTHTVGSSLNSIAVGDFNRDGKSDLAVAGLDCLVLLGNGDGTFQPAVSLNLRGFAVATGDFNGDGRLDLAVAASPSGKIAVLLGKGDGTFQPPGYLNAEVNFWAPWSNPLCVGDFNGDGKLDLAVASSSSSISVSLGNGDGTFQPPVTRNYSSGYNSSPHPQSLAAGDFNGDGKLDLAVVNDAGGSDIFGPFITNSVSMFLGNGDGTFQPPSNYPMFSLPTMAAVGDFNGDGKLDLAVANGSVVSILTGDGDGTLQPAVNFDGFGYSVAVGDFNGDGKPDLGLAGDGVLVLLNTSRCAGPHLDVTRDQKTFTLSWPLPYANFVLESATDLNSTNWQPVSELITTNNGRCETAVAFDQTLCFFRLRKLDTNGTRTNAGSMNIAR